MARRTTLPPGPSSLKKPPPVPPVRFKSDGAIRVSPRAPVPPPLPIPRDILVSFVPWALVKQFVLDPTPLTSPSVKVEADAVVVFVDVSGFTALGELLAQFPGGAELLTLAINKFFSSIIDQIKSLGGSIERFAGDAIIAVFGGQFATVEQRALHAVHCATALQYGQYEISIPNGEIAILAIHIGIAAGELTGLAIGGANGYWRRVVLGDPFRQLESVMDSSKVGDIVLSPEAYTLAASYTDCEMLESGDYKLKALINCPMPHKDLFLKFESLTDAVIPALRPFIDWNVLRRLEAGQVNILAEVRPVTVLFVSLPNLQYEMTESTDRNFIQLHNAIKTIQQVLLRYEGSMSNCLVDEKGTSVLLTFGNPLHEDDAARAVRAAFEIRQELSKIQVDVGVGITSGKVFVGTVGSARRQDYTIMGAVVNLAARLMQACGRNQILVCQATFELTKSNLFFIYDELDPINVKGKSEPVPVFEPLSLADTSSPDTGSIGGSFHDSVTTDSWESTRGSTRITRFNTGRSPVLLVLGQVDVKKQISNALRAARKPVRTGMSLFLLDNTYVFDYAELASAMDHPVTGVPVADRRWRLHMYKQCFVGSELVTWMIRYAKLPHSRETIQQRFQSWVDDGLIVHPKGKRMPFLDGFHFYFFTNKFQALVNDRIAVKVNPVLTKIAGLTPRSMSLTAKRLSGVAPISPPKCRRTDSNSLLKVAHVYFLCGNPGWGKSTIARWAATQALKHDFRPENIMDTACDEVEKGTPFFVWKSVFSRLMLTVSNTIADRQVSTPGSDETTPPETESSRGLTRRRSSFHLNGPDCLDPIAVKSALHHILDKDHGALTVDIHLPAFNFIFGAGFFPAHDSFLLLDSTSISIKLKDMLIHVLEWAVATSTAHPLFICIEDVHRGMSDDDLDLVKRVLRMCLHYDNPGFVMMLTSRHLEEETVCDVYTEALRLEVLDHPSVRYMCLQPMSVHDTAELLKDHLKDYGVNEVQDQLAQWVWTEATQGNPFHVGEIALELAKHLMDENTDAISVVLGELRLTSGLSALQALNIHLSESAVSFYRARFDRLGITDQLLLKVASCMQNKFGGHTIKGILNDFAKLGLSEEEVTERCAELVRQGWLIQAKGPPSSTRQALVWVDKIAKREVYSTQLLDQRRNLHRTIAKYTETVIMGFDQAFYNKLEKVIDRVEESISDLMAPHDLHPRLASPPMIFSESLARHWMYCFDPSLGSMPIEMSSMPIEMIEASRLPELTRAIYYLRLDAKRVFRIDNDATEAVSLLRAALRLESALKAFTEDETKGEAPFTDTSSALKLLILMDLIEFAQHIRKGLPRLQLYEWLQAALVEAEVLQDKSALYRCHWGLCHEMLNALSAEDQEPGFSLVALEHARKCAQYARDPDVNFVDRDVLLVQAGRQLTIACKRVGEPEEALKAAEPALGLCMANPALHVSHSSIRLFANHTPIYLLQLAVCRLNLHKGNIKRSKEIHEQILKFALQNPTLPGSTRIMTIVFSLYSPFQERDYVTLTKTVKIAIDQKANIVGDLGAFTMLATTFWMAVADVLDVTATQIELALSSLQQAYDSLSKNRSGLNVIFSYVCALVHIDVIRRHLQYAECKEWLEYLDGVVEVMSAKTDDRLMESEAKRLKGDIIALRFTISDLTGERCAVSESKGYMLAEQLYMESLCLTQRNNQKLFELYVLYSFCTLRLRLRYCESTTAGSDASALPSSSTVAPSTTALSDNLRTTADFLKAHGGHSLSILSAVDELLEELKDDPFVA